MLPHLRFLNFAEMVGTSTWNSPKDANSIRLWSLFAKLDWDLDFTKLVAVSGYSRMKQYQGGDVGAAPTPRSNFSL